VARTATEKRIIERRNAKGILVPILEETLSRPLDVEDDADFEFVMGMMKSRAQPREKGVFSPSMLSSCMRQSYFAKTGVDRRYAESPRSNGFFLDGNFRHYKWQFALWKAHKKGLLVLVGVEVRVFHPNGDYAGTIDALVIIDGELFIVDFKGMNVSSFTHFEENGAEMKHRIQIVGYGMIVNIGLVPVVNDEWQKLLPITRCLLIGENKSGPTQKGSPIALHEDVIEIAKYRREVKTRISELRKAVENEEVPGPSCTSTRTKQFQECAFAYLCREEVRAIQRDRESANRRNPDKPKVKISTRARTSSPKRRTG
jgi:hypothetical protein